MRKRKISHIWYIILIILAAIYFYLYKYKKNITEPFSSTVYRPHLRNMRLKYEHFMNNYGYPGHKYIMNKF